MDTNRRVNVIIYGGMDVLQNIPPAWSGDLIVEVSTKPALAFELNRLTPSDYPGIAGILGGIPLDELSCEECEDKKLILAPGTDCSRNAIWQALAVLPNAMADNTATTVLIPYNEYETWEGCLDFIDSLSALWDARIPVQPEFEETIQRLTKNPILEHLNWLGMKFYATEQFISSDQSEFSDLVPQQHL
ncbi:MAG: hypothetical protein AAFX93_18345 [Verrucomicrobiota bacterium]